MSLIERVRAAGNASSYLSPADDAGLGDRLRDELEAIMPLHEVAALAASNPVRARNEIKSACKAIFEGGHWAGRDEGQKAELVDGLLDDVFGFGPLEGLLADDDVTEIMVNGVDSVYFEKEGRLYRDSFTFSDDGQVRALIDRIIGPLGRRVDESSPMVNARLPQGYRVNAIIPPLSLMGSILTIRKFSAHVITLDEMVERKTMDARTKQFLEWAVQLRKNIAVSGGTGSGKTTLLNALSCKIAPEERIITIEDSAELRFFEHPHVVRLEARPRNAEGSGEVAIRDLVVNALRMRPDRIVVGECRAGEALDMLQAMNTGHDGSLTTLHANAPEEALMRLTTMVQYAVDLPVEVIEAQIASAIDLIIQIARDQNGQRFLTGISALGYSREEGRCIVQTIFSRPSVKEAGSWVTCPSWIDEAIKREEIDAEEGALWRQAASCA